MKKIEKYLQSFVKQNAERRDSPLVCFVPVNAVLLGLLGLLRLFRNGFLLGRQRVNHVPADDGRAANVGQSEEPDDDQLFRQILTRADKARLVAIPQMHQLIFLS